MSSTIKAAILALKSRIADAYTAISAKGGTLPAQQTAANLPTAIASIPTGGGSGLYYSMADLGVPSSMYSLLNDVTDEDIAESLPSLGTLDNVPYVVYNGNLPSNGIREKRRIKALFMTGGSLGQCNYGFYQCYALQYIVLDQSVNTSLGNTANPFWYCDSLVAIVGKEITIDSGAVSNAFASCYNLRKIKLRLGTSVASINLSICPLDYESNLYLVSNLPAVTGTHTLTIGSTNKAILNATAEGQAAIATAQGYGWTIA